jgi:prepilin-type N-terminal cleavage/methylation domain-containing protein
MINNKYELFKQQGDTIVEVLMAIVILSMVLAGAYSLTNRAQRLNRTSYERTEISNQMSEQAEFLRGARTQNTPLWQSFLSGGYETTGNPDYDNCWPSPGSSPFYVDNSGSIQPYSTASPAVDAYPSDIYKIWVEAYSGSSGELVQFHVRGCWEGIGSSPEQRAVIYLSVKK